MSRLRVGLRDDGVRAHHRIRLRELLRRLESLPVDRERREERLGREVGGERVGQPEHRRELGAVEARAEDPERHLRARSRHRPHCLARNRVGEVPLELHHVLREGVGGRGVAAHFTFGSYVAHVAEVSVDATGRPRVQRIVAAVDCGRVVNPSGAEAQVQGGVIDGLSAALFGQITVDRGRVRQSNFGDYRLLRMRDTPLIEIHFVASDDPPSGLGEPPVSPVAPAVANAMFSLTGKRIRRLPFGAPVG